MRDIFDLTVKENREYRRKHPRVWRFAEAYKFWRSAPYSLTREETLLELKGCMDSGNALRIAEVIDRVVA